VLLAARWLANACDERQFTASLICTIYTEQRQQEKLAEEKKQEAAVEKAHQAAVKAKQRLIDKWTKYVYISPYEALFATSVVERPRLCSISAQSD